LLAGIAGGLLLVCLGAPSALGQARPRADVQLIDKTTPPGDVLPPGPPIFTCRNVIVDTGSPKTIFDRDCAVGFGLMAGAPPAPVPGFLDPANPAKRIGGIGGGGIAINQSRPLSVNAGGLGQPLVRFKDVPNIRVQYPSPIAGVSLLGTDYMTNLAAGQATTMRRDQSVSFYDDENAQVGFHAPFQKRPGLEGGIRYVFPVGTVVAQGPSGIGSADFTIGTGCPSSIITSSLAAQLGVVAGSPVTLDSETQGELYADEFINMSTQLFNGMIPSLTVNTSDGPLTKTNVPVWINPDSSENVFGFPELFFDNDTTEIRVHEFNDVTFAPAPGALGLVGVGTLLAARRRRVA
jgi:MYXO-CTERM domain-containing protein